MEERVLTVAKALGRGELGWDGQDTTYCFYCSFRTEEPIEVNEDDPDPQHDSQCPITLARMLLRDEGIILKVYCISFEVFEDVHGLLSKDVVKWETRTEYISHYSEEEAWAVVQKDLAVHKDWPPMRNHQVTFVREVAW